MKSVRMIIMLRVFTRCGSSTMNSNRGIGGMFDWCCCLSIFYELGPLVKGRFRSHLPLKSNDSPSILSPVSAKKRHLFDKNYIGTNSFSLRSLCAFPLNSDNERLPLWSTFLKCSFHSSMTQFSLRFLFKCAVRLFPSGVPIPRGSWRNVSKHIH